MFQLITNANGLAGRLEFKWSSVLSCATFLFFAAMRSCKVVVQSFGAILNEQEKPDEEVVGGVEVESEQADICISKQSKQRKPSNQSRQALQSKASKAN